MANMTIYEALGALCGFLDMSSSIGCFSEDELEEIEMAESVIQAYINEKESESENEDESFTLI